MPTKWYDEHLRKVPRRQQAPPNNNIIISDPTDDDVKEISCPNPDCNRVLYRRLTEGPSITCSFCHSLVKPKHGKYQCLYCKEDTVEGYFLPTDVVYCYLCGMQMLVKDMVKIERPKEIKIKPLNNGVTGAFVKYDYGPDANGQLKVNNITVNGVPYIYRGKRI